MPRPNFFIVGAPKCGTTALRQYLLGHPGTFFCEPKEPHYFATDFPSHRYVATEENYIKLFDRAGDACKVIGEASSWYLYSREALPNIRQFDPDAKIVAMLRNPIEMTPSLHAQLLRDFAESEPDLRRAWDLQEERRDPKLLPKNRNTRYDPRTFLYGEACKLGEQVERLLGIFPREQVKIILFDDFSRDTKAVYESVLSFLDLPADGREDFAKANVRRDYRSRRAGRLLFAIWSAASRLKSRMGILTTFGLFKRLERFTMEAKEPGVPDPEFRARLASEFRSDIEVLSRTLGRDLSHWSERPD
ncbi:MAG: sulfotransferase [Myxococcota bacterium]